MKEKSLVRYLNNKKCETFVKLGVKIAFGQIYLSLICEEHLKRCTTGKFHVKKYDKHVTVLHQVKHKKIYIPLQSPHSLKFATFISFLTCFSHVKNMKMHLAKDHYPVLY